MTAAARPTGRRNKFLLRPWVRALHRDLGYTAVGLTFVYALSGLAVNHIPDWDPNFQNLNLSHDLGPITGDDDAATATVLAKLGIHQTPKESYREGDELEILLEHRTLHVTTATGHVVDEQQKPRFFLRAANYLHLNRGKKSWRNFADAYAIGLLLLATSGLFMIPGRRGLLGRGAVFLAIGIAIPVGYLMVFGGP